MVQTRIVCRNMYGDVHALIKFATSLMQTAAAEVAAAAAAAVAAELLPLVGL